MMKEYTVKETQYTSAILIFCLLSSGSQHLQDKEFAPRGKNSFLLRVELLWELKDQSDQGLYYLLRPVCPST